MAPTVGQHAQRAEPADRAPVCGEHAAHQPPVDTRAKRGVGVGAPTRAYGIPVVAKCLGFGHGKMRPKRDANDPRGLIHIAGGERTD